MSFVTSTGVNMGCHSAPARFSGVLLVIAMALALSACPSAPQPAPEQPQETPTGIEVLQRDFPGAKTYHVIGRESLVRILVQRAGSMKGAGHNHVVSSQDVHGNVYWHEDSAKSGFDLVMPVNLLEIDNEQLRAEEGPDFAAKVSDAAKAGTRRNMLSEALLDGARFPGVALSSTSIEGNPPALVAHTIVKIRDQRQELAIPVSVESQDGKLVATGEFEFRQTQFGITPFSILLGAVQVADAVKVRFRIVAAEHPADAPRQ